MSKALFFTYCCSQLQRLNVNIIYSNNNKKPTGKHVGFRINNFPQKWSKINAGKKNDFLVLHKPNACSYATALIHKKSPLSTYISSSFIQYVQLAAECKHITLEPLEPYALMTPTVHSEGVSMGKVPGCGCLCY